MMNYNSASCFIWV